MSFVDLYYGVIRVSLDYELDILYNNKLRLDFPEYYLVPLLF